MLFDSHMHYAAAIGETAFDEVRRRAGIDRCCLLSIPAEGTRSTVADCLRYKARHAAGTVYVQGSFDRLLYARHAGNPAALGSALVLQARRQLDAGCDGMKLLEGKPDIRRQFPIPDFDSEAWEPFWAFAEQVQLPVTLHLNDPEEFWDANKISPYALRAGWLYGPDTINNEEQYRQMDAVLTRHPRLKLCLAHLYFFSGQLPRLTALLERCRSLRVDLTPGIELYQNLGANIDGARALFALFGDRILFGTDIGSRATIAEPPREIAMGESLARIQIIRTFLESGEAHTIEPDGAYLFGIPPFPMRGLGLGENALKRVYQTNAESYLGSAPAPVKLALLESL